MIASSSSNNLFQRDLTDQTARGYGITHNLFAVVAGKVYGVWYSLISAHHDHDLLDISFDPREKTHIPPFIYKESLFRECIMQVKMVLRNIF